MVPALYEKTLTISTDVVSPLLSIAANWYALELSILFSFYVGSESTNSFRAGIVDASSLSLENFMDSALCKWFIIFEIMLGVSIFESWDVYNVV